MLLVNKQLDKIESSQFHPLAGDENGKELRTKELPCAQADAAQRF